MISTAQIRPSSIILVSGGAKGITAKCVIQLAQHHQCKFILLGRSAILESEPDFAQGCFEESALKKCIVEYQRSQGEKPTPMSVQKIFNRIYSSREIKNTLSSIEQVGNKAEYINVDITDELALKEKVADSVKRLGAITGIIHGAGNLADKLIEKKTEQDFETVYAAKVKGLENLLSCVNLSQLEHLVLFSSSSGFYGNIGQADYAIANEILNKSAHLVKQKYPNCHVIAMNWGPWESRMVTPELKKVFAQRNIGIIPIEVGTKMLVNQLNTANHATAQVVVSSPATLPARELDSELRAYRIHRQIILEANPFLQDHVIAGNPVLPATCAMAWIINSCENLYPGYRVFSVSNLKVLKGIIFNENVAKEYILELQEISKEHAQRIEFSAKVLSINFNQKVHYHFSVQLKLLRKIPPSLIYKLEDIEETFLSSRNKNFYQTWDNLYQNWIGTLFHGPSFRGVEKVLKLSKKRITTECLWREITQKQQGQFPVQWVNPYTTDISAHPLGIWLQHFHQESGLPAYVEKYEQFAPTPCNKPFYVSCEIKNKTNRSLISDVIIHSFNGQVYSRLIGLKFVIWSLK